MRYGKLFSVTLCSVLIFLYGCEKKRPELTVINEQKERMKELYKFDTWMPEDEKELRRIGVRIDDLEIPKFRLVKTKFYSPVPGVTYVWKASKGSSLIDITVKVCRSREEAFEDTIDYLAFGTNRHLEKSDEVIVGNVAFFDRKYPTIIFVRDNVMVVLHSASRRKSAFYSLIDIASKTDKRIIDSPIETRRRSVMMPRISGVELVPSKIKVGRKSEIIVSAFLEGSKKLYYKYSATGGNILKGKGNKMYYFPEKSGRQKIRVFVGNEYNVVSSFVKEIRVSK